MRIQILSRTRFLRRPGSGFEEINYSTYCFSSMCAGLILIVIHLAFDFSFPLTRLSKDNRQQQIGAIWFIRPTSPSAPNNTDMRRFDISCWKVICFAKRWTTTPQQQVICRYCEECELTQITACLALPKDLCSAKWSPIFMDIYTMQPACCRMKFVKRTWYAPYESLEIFLKAYEIHLIW